MSTDNTEEKTEVVANQTNPSPLWMGPGHDHLPVEEPGTAIEPQDWPADPEPMFITAPIKIPKETYTALGKLTFLLKSSDNPDEVGRVVVEAIEQHIPVLLGRVAAINKGREIDTLYSKFMKTT